MYWSLVVYVAKPDDRKGLYMVGISHSCTLLALLFGERDGRHKANDAVQVVYSFSH